MKRYFLLFLMLTMFLLSLEGEAKTPSRKILFLALDGIPHSLMTELKNEGYFKKFQPPTKVISPFPSTTMSGFGGIFEPLGTGKPLGYEEIFFSEKEQRVQGSILGGLVHEHNDYRSLFDYYRRTTGQQLTMYAFPGLTVRHDLMRLKKIILEERSDASHYFFYIGGTDGAGHILGRDRTKRMLIFIDRWLTRFMRIYERRTGEKIDIVLFSDHGFYFEKPKAISNRKLKDRFAEAGFTLSNELKEPHQVISISWGNISGGSFYAFPSQVSKVASLLVGIEGMDIVLFRSGQDARILATRGEKLHEALIRYDKKKNRYAYFMIDGDPLNYKSLLKKLTARGKQDAQGFIADKDWFQATKDHFYPDALHRLHSALFSLVQNPAPLLYSTHKEYEFGNGTTRFGARLRGGFKGTHGGLFHDASDAMVMSTNPAFQPQETLRYRELFPILLKRIVNGGINLHPFSSKAKVESPHH